MKSPFALHPEWLRLDEVDSTQRVAAECLKNGTDVGGVLAFNQTRGVGRFGREWISQPGDSLTMTLLFHEYADHPRPFLIGMGVALAAAGALHFQLRWPNDLMIGDFKVGGILTELLPDQKGRRVPAVGVGINLNQTAFPAEISDRATSLSLAHGGHYEYQAVAKSIVSRLKSLPEPDHWSDLEPIWSLFDRTPGKRYQISPGEEAVAIGIGSEGQLLCTVEGESRSVLAADAIFGAAENK